MVAWTKSLNRLHVPPPPQWVAKIPLRGLHLHDAWQQFASQGSGALAERVSPYAGKYVAWFASRMGAIGAMILQFLITVIIAAVLYGHGESAARGVRAFAYRLAGSQGDKEALLAAGSIRSVAMGVIVTAIVQTIIAAIGLAIASIPGTLLCDTQNEDHSREQVGPVLVLVPVLIWKFSTGDILGGSVLLVFTVPAITLDNIMRPVLIRKGAGQPLILIFAGVIGGMISLGVIGIFVGPALLAVTYVLVKEWVADRPEAQDQAVSARTAQASASRV
jgi:predicted PurR-regulated permease PerM